MFFSEQSYPGFGGSRLQRLQRFVSFRVVLGVMSGSVCAMTSSKLYY